MANKFDSFNWEELNTIWLALFDQRKAAELKGNQEVYDSSDALMNMMYSANNWGTRGLKNV